MVRKLYVLAGNYNQAKFFHRHHYPDTELVYVGSTQQLRGLRDITLHTVGTASTRNQALDILQLARARNINIVNE